MESHLGGTQKPQVCRPVSTQDSPLQDPCGKHLICLHNQRGKCLLLLRVEPGYGASSVLISLENSGAQGLTPGALCQGAWVSQGWVGGGGLSLPLPQTCFYLTTSFFLCSYICSTNMCGEAAAGCELCRLTTRPRGSMARATCAIVCQGQGDANVTPSAAAPLSIPSAHLQKALDHSL